ASRRSGDDSRPGLARYPPRMLGAAALDRERARQLRGPRESGGAPARVRAMPQRARGSAPAARRDPLRRADPARTASLVPEAHATDRRLRKWRDRAAARNSSQERAPAQEGAPRFLARDRGGSA